jgi:hypothetical protein
VSRPEPTDDLRDEAVRGQTQRRRAKRGEARSTNRTLDQLPLFADERSLSEAVLGRGTYTHWRALVPLLEARGFPKIDGLMGGRYVPAVKAFFDREYNVGGATQVFAPDAPAELGAWKKRRGAHGRQHGQKPFEEKKGT